MDGETLTAAATLAGLVRQTLERDASRPAIEYDGRWFTVGEMRQVAERLGAALAATGAGQRQPVALIPRNRPSAIAALLGLIADGRTIQMVYAFQSQSAIAQNIERLKPAVVVAAPSELGEEVKAVLKARGIAAIAIEDMDARPLLGFGQAALTSDEGAPAEPEIQILTSGTTGPPKQCPFPYTMFLRHHVLPAMGMAPGGRPGQEAPPGADWLEETPYLLFFPLGNISGMYSTLPTMIRGQRAVLLDRFSIDAWHDWVVRYRPVNGGLPPAGVQMVLDAEIPPEDLSSIRFVGTGAAPLDPTVHRNFEERYGIPILLSYGATEFGGPVVAMTPDLVARWGKEKLGSVGQVMPGCKVRVVDAETGAELPPGQEGLVEVVSPRIGPDWIRTSDVALFDEDGFMFHRGRADGAIMRGGFKLIPEGIERALLLHPAVAAAAVVGRKDRRLGEVPVAAIQLKAGTQWPGGEALETHIRQHVASTHVPVDWLPVDEVPRNRSMKVDRPAVRRLFQSADG